ncbi:unnamed protein product [Lota lota]
MVPTPPLHYCEAHGLTIGVNQQHLPLRDSPPPQEDPIDTNRCLSERQLEERASVLRSSSAMALTVAVMDDSTIASSSPSYTQDLYSSSC